MRKHLFLLALFITFSHFALGQIPKSISYQGVLTESDGTTVSDGNYSMTFSIYTSESGGTHVWQEAKAVEVINGVFNVNLGDVVALNLDFKSPYWLGVKVGVGAEMTPRVKFTASAYSLNSQRVGGYEVSATPAANKLIPLDGSAKLPAAVIPAMPVTHMGGTSGGSSISITTTTFTELLSFTVNQTGTFDATLNANLVGEISGDGNGRYEFWIAKGSPTGTVIAKGWWRPGTSAGFQAVTIALTGVDTDGNGPTTYYLVGRKYDSGAKDLSAFIYFLNATWVTN